MHMGEGGGANGFHNNREWSCHGDHDYNYVCTDSQTCRAAAAMSGALQKCWRLTKCSRVTGTVKTVTRQSTVTTRYAITKHYLIHWRFLYPTRHLIHSSYNVTEVRVRQTTLAKTEIAAVPYA